MLITSPRYYYKYSIKSKVFGSPVWERNYPGITKPILISYLNSPETINLHLQGCTVIAWAPYTENNQTRVKPQNVLYVDRPHSRATIHQLMVSLSWEMDLRTINLDDYPEFFI